MLIIQAFLQTAGQITFNCKLIFKNGFRLVLDPPDMPPIKQLPTSGKRCIDAPFAIPGIQKSKYVHD
ncbi:MAG: hypothetical protein HWD63_05845 [Candidatus Parvibacillus calidus]|nr:MAG: hypothetical protein HWD63_05845 [Candidatus Parvibacillus calidus]